MELMKKYIKISKNINYLDSVEYASNSIKEYKKDLKQSISFSFLISIVFLCLYYLHNLITNSVKDINVLNGISNESFHLMTSISRIVDNNILLSFDFYLFSFSWIFIFVFSTFIIFYYKKIKKKDFKILQDVVYFIAALIFLFGIMFYINGLIRPIFSVFIIFSGFCSVATFFQFGYNFFLLNEIFIVYIEKNKLKKEYIKYTEYNLEKLKEEKDKILKEILNKREYITQITKIYYSNDFLQKDQVYYERIINEFKNINEKEKSEDEKIMNLIDKTFSTSKIKNY